MKQKLFIMCLAATLSACGPDSAVDEKAHDANAQKHHADHARNELVPIAENYLAEHRPEWANVDDLQVRITEHPDYWAVTWDLPPNTVGGPPVVHIDKKTHEVIKAYHGQ